MLCSKSEEMEVAGAKARNVKAKSWWWMEGLVCNAEELG